MIKDNTTRELILAHYQKYPLLQLNDLFKFLHQSSFGCEHLISSQDAASEYIKSEYSSAKYTDRTEIEALDGKYSRVHLAYLDKGLTADTLSKLLFFSAKTEKDGRTNLEKKLEEAKQLVLQGQIPFSVNDYETALSDWKQNGYPALHHSDEFRKNYTPSYRVISNDFIPFLPLFSKIDQMLKIGRVTLAVEGGSASGKTTLGNILSQIYDCTIFHADDFFLRPEQRTPERFAEVGGNFDRERFEDEVLIPLSYGRPIEYKRFDCSSFTILPPVTYHPKKLTVIEGAYCMHPDISKYYNASVFLDIDEKLQKNRIQKRNTPQIAKRFFEEWIPMEKVYFEKTGVKDRCDLIIKI